MADWPRIVQGQSSEAAVLLHSPQQMQIDESVYANSLLKP